MSITYLDAKRLLAKWAGRGGLSADSQSPELDLFCRKVFQHLLISGQHGSLRKFCFNAVKGCITAPYELEVPLKVRIDGNVGTVWNRWFEFYHAGELDKCVPASEALFEESNTFPTVYDLPNEFCRVGVIGTAKEDEDAHCIISGLDPSGREIITNHNGETISGEYLRIKQGVLRYTQAVFGKITGVVKSKTIGYVQLLWHRPELNLRGFLSDYSPFEEIQSYRRFRLTTPNCGSCIKVSVLGKIRIKNHYADNDILPFENLLPLELAAQECNAQSNTDPEMAKAKSNALNDEILKENEYKRIQPGSPVDIYQPLSAGAIKNIVGY